MFVLMTSCYAASPWLHHLGRNAASDGDKIPMLIRVNLELRARGERDERREGHGKYTASLLPAVTPLYQPAAAERQMPCRDHQVQGSGS